MPLPPDLGGGEHTTLTAHVTESGLTGTVGTTTGDTGNPGDSTTGTPRFGRVLMTSLHVYSVRLTVVLRHVCVSSVDEIWTDGRDEHSGHRLLADLSGIRGGENGNKRACSSL